TDLHTETLGQLALTEMITSHTYDRHIRACRLHYRRRRDLLIERLGRRYQLHGIAAGLHALLHLPATGASEGEIIERAASHGLALGALRPHWHTPTGAEPKGLIVGYATPSQASYAAALDTLARTLRTT
ncbi:MAG TPA: PLP-dependent aminotransferase family protein, partial [Micromonospora sp.]|nr:PLP-dependent aminotransferase family protein [Micromonospora sp.]